MINTVATIAKRRSEGATLDEIAAELHVTVDWIQIVMSSDSYEVIAHDHEQRKNGGGDEQ